MAVEEPSAGRPESEFLGITDVRRNPTLAKVDRVSRSPPCAATMSVLTKKTSVSLCLSILCACAPQPDGATVTGAETGSSSSGTESNADASTAEASTAEDVSTSTGQGQESTSASSSASTDEGADPTSETSSTSSSDSSEDETSSESTSGSDTETGGEARWVGTWGSGQQRVAQQDHFPPQSLSDNTLRQFVYTTIGGDEARIQISNEYGDGPLTINAAHIAVATQLPSIEASTDTAITFSGSASATVQPGEFLYSDAIPFSVPEQSFVAVSIYFGATPEAITAHPGSRTTSYIANGDNAAAASFDVAASTDRWYYLTRLEVMAPATSHAVVVMGDSISDGFGTTTNGNDRWPDVFSRRLRANAGTAGVALVNEAMGANGLVGDDFASMGRIPGVQRFERDVLTQEGVRWVIILMGVNDILYGGASAGSITGAYEQMIAAAHAEDIEVYGVPILPFQGHTESTEAKEDIRNEINVWMRSSGAFDAVLELGAVVSDAEETRLQPSLTSDNLHPNVQGYELMGNAVPLDLFME